jgi:hypothetical protein
MPSDIPVLRCTFSNEEIIHLIVLSSIYKEVSQLTFLAQATYDIIKSID